MSADSGLQRNKQHYSSDTRYRTARRIADLLITAIQRRLASSAGGAVKDPLFLRGLEFLAGSRELAAARRIDVAGATRLAGLGGKSRIGRGRTGDEGAGKHDGGDSRDG